MATSDRGLTQIELSRQANAMSLMVDSGDHQTFTQTGVRVWSGDAEYEPEVRPNGIVSGRNMLSPKTAVDNALTTVTFTADSKGVLHTVAAGDVPGTITRPTTDGNALISSVVMSDTGVLSIIAGTEGSDANFSETYGAAGGPPEIPLDSVQIGQVRVTDSADAPIAAEEIFQVDGEHTERFDSPMWDPPNTTGNGMYADTTAEKYAFLKFTAALPLIHTDGVPKRVYIKTYTPQLADIARSADYAPAEISHSASSEPYYNGSIASSSESLGQCSFTILAGDNITDAVIGLKNKTVTVKFFPDRNKTAYMLQQGRLGISRTFNLGAQNKTAVTLTCENASVEFDA